MRIVALSLLLTITSIAGEKPMNFIKNGKLDLDAVVDHFEDLYRSKSSISRLKLLVTRPRHKRELVMTSWTRGKDKALIVIESPIREKGTATLKVDKNLWNFLPRIKRTIRIPPSMMLGAWMGSDFTNDDLVRETSFRNDYTYQLAGKTADGKGWKVIFKAKPDVVGLWERFELVISADGKVPVSAQYFDRRGRLARTLAWSEVKKVDGRMVPMHLTLVPTDQQGHKTELIYLDIKFDIDVPESTFSLSRLERKR